MIVEKLFGKIEKLFGGDAIESRWYEAELYEFTLEKEVSSEKLVGHGWKWNSEGDVVVYRIDGECGWALATVYPISDSNEAVLLPGTRGLTVVETVSGVESVSDKEIGMTTWDIDVDFADGTIESVSCDESVPIQDDG